MTIAIKRWGNSSGIVIPALFLKQIGAKIGQEMDIEVKDGALILRPKRYSLVELIQQCDPAAPLETEESIWGVHQTSVDKEVW